MQREIKFRAWFKSYEDSDGQMVELPMQLLRFDYEDGWVLAFTDYEDFAGHERYENRKPFQWELMQYTGIDLTVGVSIVPLYEGDIYHMGDPKIRYVIEFSEGQFAGRQVSNKSNAGLQWWRKEITLMGNMYENPELLS